MAIPGANVIKELIPRNFSLVTKQFCIRFDNHIEYNNLLPKISSVIPEAATKILGDQVEDLHLEQISTGVTPFRYCLILGLVWIAIMAVIFVVMFACSMFSRLFHFGGVLTRLFCFGGVLARVIICIVSGILCFILFLIPAIIIHIMLARANDLLTSSIEIQKGEVSRYCWGTVGYTAIAMILMAFLPAFV